MSEETLWGAHDSIKKRLPGYDDAQINDLTEALTAPLSTTVLKRLQHYVALCDFWPCSSNEAIYMLSNDHRMWFVRMDGDGNYLQNYFRSHNNDRHQALLRAMLDTAEFVPRWGFAQCWRQRNSYLEVERRFSVP